MQTNICYTQYKVESFILADRLFKRKCYAKKLDY